MDGYYHNDQLQRQISQQAQQAQQQNGQVHGQVPHSTSVSLAGLSAQAPAPQMPHGMLHGQPNMGGDPLDDIVGHDQDSIYRRRSMPRNFGNGMSQNNGPRRMSSVDSGEMLTFGPCNDDLREFQFNQPMPGPFPTLNAPHLNIQSQMANYLADQTDYPSLSPDLMGSMVPTNLANMNMSALGADPQMAMFSSSDATSMPPQYAQAQMGPMGHDFPLDMGSETPLNAGGNKTAGVVGSVEDVQDDMMRVPPQYDDMERSHAQPPGNLSLDSNMAGYNQNMPPSVSHQGSSTPAFSAPRDASSTIIANPSSSSESATPASRPGPPPPDQETKAIYSKSGFDMLKALWLVATRKNPKIHLGAVDMSCAFVVCDVTMNDCPIIYVSDNFQNLTGYSRHEIVGKNCRFLQAPDGKVEPGAKREFVDDGAVYNLKKMIEEGREVQQSLINYRKGGKPFLNLLTMIPIPWDTDEIRYFIGFQIDLVECPDAIASGQELGGVKVNYKHSDIGQYIWTPPASAHWEPDNGQTLGVDDVSTLLQQFTPKGIVSDWHKQSWDKMLLENTDDVVHVLSLKGLFLYLSPSCKRVLEYDMADLVGNALSTVCHPSDIVPVTRELKDTSAGKPVNIVFRIRRKNSGYTWFESHGSLFVEQGKGRKCIILVGRKRPVIALSRYSLECHGGIGDSELWTKLSTSGMFLFVPSNIRPLLDLRPEALAGTSIQDLMRRESRAEFGRAIEKARRGKIVACKHEVQNRRGQVLQAQTTLYPGDAVTGEKPSFLLAQTKLLKASTRSIAPAGSARSGSTTAKSEGHMSWTGHVSHPAGGALTSGTHDAALASDDNMFDELRTTKCSSWEFELRQMEKINRILAEELGGLLSNKKKRKRRKGVGNIVTDCANCHTRDTPEWRRGPSGQRDLCNSCGLRWAKQTGRVSPRNSSRGHPIDSHSKKSLSPVHSSPLHRELSASDTPTPITGNGLINPAQLTKHNGSSSAPTVPAASISSAMMPPHSHPSGMAAIREERESSQAS